MDPSLCVFILCDAISCPSFPMNGELEALADTRFSNDIRTLEAMSVKG